MHGVQEYHSLAADQCFHRRESQPQAASVALEKVESVVSPHHNPPWSCSDALLKFPELSHSMQPPVFFQKQVQQESRQIESSAYQSSAASTMQSCAGLAHNTIITPPTFGHMGDGQWHTPPPPPPPKQHQEQQEQHQRLALEPFLRVLAKAQLAMTLSGPVSSTLPPLLPPLLPARTPATDYSGGSGGPLCPAAAYSGGVGGPPCPAAAAGTARLQPAPWWLGGLVGAP